MGFIEEIAPLVQKYARKYGIGVCSPIIAQGVLESQFGKSELGVKAMNYFGMKYRKGRVPCASGVYYKVGSEQNKDGTYVSSNMKWLKFNSPDSAIEGYFQFINTPNYANLKGVLDPRRYLELIKADGYATSLKYVDNLMAVIDKYDLRKYDNMTTEDNDKMGYILKVNYADKSNYGSSRDMTKIKHIVWHYTANDGDSDESNAKFFKTKNRKASAHYFVDSDSVTISVPDTVVAWSVGGKRYANYKQTGGASLYGKCTNANSISIELTDDKKDGVIMASEKTIDNAIELTRELMNRYNIPIENVVRHFDVVGKSCPAYYVDSLRWGEVKARIAKNTQSVPTPTPVNNKVVDSSSNPIHATVQKWINDYLDTSIDEDGKFGDISKKHLNMCLEKALGLGVRNGVLTTAELSKITYTKVKASTELTKVLEAYLFVRGFNPQDFSGSYADSVMNAVKEFQKTVFKSAKDIDGKAGSGTFTKIVF